METCPSHKNCFHSMGCFHTKVVATFCLRLKNWFQPKARPLIGWPAGTGNQRPGFWWEMTGIYLVEKLKNTFLNENEDNYDLAWLKSILKTRPNRLVRTKDFFRLWDSILWLSPVYYGRRVNRCGWWVEAVGVLWECSTTTRVWWPVIWEVWH